MFRCSLTERDLPCSSFPCFFKIPCFFPLRGNPCFFKCFSPSSRMIGVRQGQNILVFCWRVSLLLLFSTKTQGWQGQFPEKRFRRFRFRLRFLEKRFRRFGFPVPVRFLGHPARDSQGGMPNKTRTKKIRPHQKITRKVDFPEGSMLQYTPTLHAIKSTSVFCLGFEVLGCPVFAYLDTSETGRTRFRRAPFHPTAISEFSCPLRTQ